jgi:hypothetical protein
MVRPASRSLSARIFLDNIITNVTDLNCILDSESLPEAALPLW